MENKVITVPTVKNVGSSFKDFGIAALGGAALAFGTRIFGGLGFLLAPLLVGAMMKNDTGKTIVIVSGIVLGLALLSGGGGGTAQSDAGVM